MRNTSKIRIFLADDHTMIREGLKLLINAQPDMEIVGEAGDGRMAVRLAQELQPDLIVIDVSMPELNGLQATEVLKRTCPQIKVLPLTRHAEGSYLQQILRAGASGYVLKQSASDELIRAIRTVISGGIYLDPAIAGKLVGVYSGKVFSQTAEAQGKLSDREMEVLQLIAWGHSNKEIASRFNISIKTVEAHKANAMRKLDLRNRIDIVRYAIFQGWLKDT